MDDPLYEYWVLVAKRGLPWFRWLRTPLTPEFVDHQLRDDVVEEDWLELREKIQPGDQIWPFNVNIRAYSGLRHGFIVIRNGEPVGGVVTTDV